MSRANFQRNRAAGGPVELFDEEAFQERVAQLYADVFELAAAEPRYGGIRRYDESNLTIIDGRGTPDEVAARVWEAVARVIA